MRDNQALLALAFWARIKALKVARSQESIGKNSDSCEKQEGYDCWKKYFIGNARSLKDVTTKFGDHVKIPDTMLKSVVDRAAMTNRE